MAGLTDTTIAASYDQLLIVDRDGGGNGTTHVTVKDGDGDTTFPVTLATDAIMITSTNRLEFGDDASYIHQSADGVLDLVSDTEIELTATTIDINGAVTVTTATNYAMTIKSTDTDAADIFRVIADDDGALLTLSKDASDDAELYLYDGSGNANVQISGNNVSYFNGGNVGIGSTSVTDITAAWASGTVLDVHESSGSDTATVIISGDTTTNGGSVGTLAFANRNNSGQDAEQAGAEGKSIANIQGVVVTSDSNGGDDSGGDLKFNTKPEAGSITERMRITSGGFVGIDRSSNIHEKLHVNGMICSTASSATSSTAGNQRAIMDLTSNAARIGHFRGTNGAGSGSVQFFVDSVEKMRLLTGGGIT